MYTLKSIARRATAFGAALTVLVAAAGPSAVVLADALNPLTERSLLLSSSAPGYQNTDGSGNATYAPPGSGPNGQKTGETFSFRVSSDSTGAGRDVKAFTLQYCTSAAGKCQAPGNNDGDARAKYPDNESGADPNNITSWGANENWEDVADWATRTPNRDSNADALADKKSDLDVNYTSPVEGTDYRVFVNNVASSGWTMSASNVEDLTHSKTLTGKRNFITLTNATGIEPASNTPIRIEFYASASNYITNPGADSFFVKMNTYDSENTAHHIPTIPYATNTHIIDGGVTVANVMTDSIHITTKVLETMSFSVGTRNRDTQNLNCGALFGTEDQPEGCEAASGAVHGTCSPIQQVNNNQLQLGDPNAEFSLETGKAHDVYSYWRLSSNSSGGATVYYSGNTLANTVGDEIAEIGAAAAASTPGTEQFGLGFVDAGLDTFDSAFTALVTGQPTRYKNPTLLLSDNETPLVPGDDIYLAPETAYANATGTIDNGSGGAGTAQFAFEKESNTIPKVIAQNNQMVISCATAKMRYVANIGADTPAGVYTTKINYLAAPQY